MFYSSRFVSVEPRSIDPWCVDSPRFPNPDMFFIKDAFPLNLTMVILPYRKKESMTFETNRSTSTACPSGLDFGKVSHPFFHVCQSPVQL